MSGVMDFFKPGRISAKDSMRVSKSLLFDCKQAAARPEWEPRLKFQTDFRSKHGLILMHVWVLHKRLIQERRNGKRVQEGTYTNVCQFIIKATP
jgi:hypothetical protein